MCLAHHARSINSNKYHKAPSERHFWRVRGGGSEDPWFCRGFFILYGPILLWCCANTVVAALALAIANVPKACLQWLKVGSAAEVLSCPTGAKSSPTATGTSKCCAGQQRDRGIERKQGREDLGPGKGKRGLFRPGRCIELVEKASAISYQAWKPYMGLLLDQGSLGRLGLDTR